MNTNSTPQESRPTDTPVSARTTVGVVDGALDGDLQALARLFPAVSFVSVGAVWPERLTSPCDILLVSANAGDVEETARRLAGAPRGCQIVVALREADAASSRRLAEAGAADVLIAPVSEAAMAVCLTRLLTGHDAPVGSGAPASGEIVAFLKAGGGVGATSLAVQAAIHLAERASTDRICLADLDLQFGIANMYLDMLDVMSMGDLLAARTPIAETPLSSALATHASGLSLLAAPRELTPLETMSAANVDDLTRALRRDFRLTLIDLPSVWTDWTSRVLDRADRIVLVTRLTVPHVHLVKRQLATLAIQRLENRPLLLVCNAVSHDEQASLSIKAAEKAIGRPFDLIAPEDRRLMLEAANQGAALAAIQHGGKLGHAVAELADRVAGREPAPAPHLPLWGKH